MALFVFRPAGGGPVGLYNRCNTCHRTAVDVKLKVCNRCHLTRYCGKECQLADWEVHKKVCADKRTTEPLKPEFKPRFDDFMHWTHKWVLPMERWANCAMDFGNKPNDHILNYCFLVELNWRESYPQSRRFSLKRAVVVTNAQAEKEIEHVCSKEPDLDFVQQVLRDWRSIRPEEDRIRILCLANCWPFTPSLAVQRDTKLTRFLQLNPPLSAYLAEHWEQKFAEAVDSGNITAGEDYINESISEWMGDELRVDDLCL